MFSVGKLSLRKQQTPGGQLSRDQIRAQAPVQRRGQCRSSSFVGVGYNSGESWKRRASVRMRNTKQ